MSRGEKIPGYQGYICGASPIITGAFKEFFSVLRLQCKLALPSRLAPNGDRRDAPRH